MSQNRFEVEPLEDRMFLSATFVSSQFVSHIVTPVPVSPVKPVPVSPVASTKLLGNGNGTFIEVGKNSSASAANYKLNGSGDVSPLGDVSITGTLHAGNLVGAPGVKSLVNVAGTLTLSNSKGSVTISLTGPVSTLTNSSSAGAVVYNYTVVSGTKAYKHYKSSGKVSLVLTHLAIDPASASASNLEGGVFSISFRKSVVVPV